MTGDIKHSGEPHPDIVRDVLREVVGARSKFPRNLFQHAAAGEEVGEVAKALLEHHRAGAPGADVYAECIQSAAMFIRLAEEGSAEFNYEFRPEYAAAFRATAEKK